MAKSSADPEVVNVYEAKTQLSKLLNRVAEGEEVIIGRSGTPVARLVPYVTVNERREFGRLSGTIRVADDFDDTPPWLIDAFEGIDATDDQRNSDASG